MTAKRKWIFAAIILATFWLALSFRMALDGLPAKLVFALGSAWVIARAYHWLKGS
jgi:hypothetical protein